MGDRKRKRQEVLVGLVRERRFTSQREAVRALHDRGVDATQASVSRDFRELGLVKISGVYRLPDSAGVERSNGRTADPVFGLITNIVPVGANLLVIRTGTGCANSVAAALDARELPGAVGTLAGDDTVFVAVRSRSDQGRVFARLREWTPRR